MNINEQCRGECLTPGDEDYGFGTFPEFEHTRDRECDCVPIKCLNYKFCENAEPEWYILDCHDGLCGICHADHSNITRLTFKDNENNEQCPVCLEEPLFLIKFPPCVHYFCKSCTSNICLWDETRYHLLSYYSYDAGLDFINQEELDYYFEQGILDILDRYSEKGTIGEGGKVRKEEHYVLQDDAKYLSVKVFNEFGMQKFVNQGVYMTSVEKNSSEPIKKLEIITIGTDGYCIHKVRWTTRIFPEYKSTDLYEWLDSFSLYLRDFYKLFIKLNSN